MGGGGYAAPNAGMDDIEAEDPELAAAIRMSLEENQRAQGSAPQEQPHPVISQPQPSQQPQP